MLTISVIVASSGRPTLRRTLNSVHSQLLPGDEVLVALQRDCPWGHKARNHLMPAARGDLIAFLDDDDIWTPNAAEIIRRGVASDNHVMHMFRMAYFSPQGSQLWQRKVVECGNVSTQMVVVPNIPEKLGRWDEEKYEGDYYFIDSTLKKFQGIVWHEEVISIVRPE